MCQCHVFCSFIELFWWTLISLRSHQLTIMLLMSNQTYWMFWCLNVFVVMKSLLFRPQSKIPQVKIWNRVKSGRDEDAKLWIRWVMQEHVCSFQTGLKPLTLLTVPPLLSNLSQLLLLFLLLLLSSSPPPLFLSSSSSPPPLFLSSSLPLLLLSSSLLTLQRIVSSVLFVSTEATKLNYQ